MISYKYIKKIIFKFQNDKPEYKEALEAQDSFFYCFRQLSKRPDISIENVNDIIDDNLKLKFQNSAVLQLLDSNYIFESFSDTKPVVMKS